MLLLWCWNQLSACKQTDFWHDQLSSPRLTVSLLNFFRIGGLLRRHGDLNEWCLIQVISSLLLITVSTQVQIWEFSKFIIRGTSTLCPNILSRYKIIYRFLFWRFCRLFLLRLLLSFALCDSLRRQRLLSTRSDNSNWLIAKTINLIRIISSFNVVFCYVYHFKCFTPFQNFL